MLLGNCSEIEAETKRKQILFERGLEHVCWLSWSSQRRPGVGTGIDDMHVVSALVKRI